MRGLFLSLLIQAMKQQGAGRKHGRMEMCFCQV